MVSCKVSGKPGDWSSTALGAPKDRFVSSQGEGSKSQHTRLLLMTDQKHPLQGQKNC